MSPLPQGLQEDIQVEEPRSKEEAPRGEHVLPMGLVQLSKAFAEVLGLEWKRGRGLVTLIEAWSNQWTRIAIKGGLRRKEM
jgi:hypothetical protein